MKTSYKKRKELKNIHLENGERCVFADGNCLTWLPLQLMHVIRTSERKDLELEINNTFLACQHHHDIFDNDNDKRWNLNNINVVLQRMKELDEKYWFRFTNLKDRL